MDEKLWQEYIAERKMLHADFCMDREAKKKFNSCAKHTLTGKTFRCSITGLIEIPNEYKARRAFDMLATLGYYLEPKECDGHWHLDYSKNINKVRKARLRRKK